MNNKIYIIATAENKHLIIPYLERLGGKLNGLFDSNDDFLDMVHEGYKVFIDNRGYFDAGIMTLEGYTEYKFPEQPSELEQLKKENEQLRECLAKGLYAVEIWCATMDGQVDEYDTQFIEQAKQLLKWLKRKQP